MDKRKSRDILVLLLPAIGMLFGVGLGVALSNIAEGILIGVGAGAVFVGIYLRKTKANHIKP